MVKSLLRFCPVTDMDDDKLGITPRTPPESPFFRGHRETVSVQKTKKRAQKCTTHETTDPATSKDDQRNVNTPDIMADTPAPKKKSKKRKTALEELAREQDKLYEDLSKIVRKSK